jgi:hypothetical protein
LSSGPSGQTLASSALGALAWSPYFYGHGITMPSSRLRTLPNTRVQRTRSSPSALRSPLTRHPLGSRGAREQGGDVSLLSVEFRTGEMILVS